MSKETAQVEDISIVMCVYNHEDTVAEAIESVLSQDTKYKYVIYCLNDASTDNSAEVILKYVEKYPNKVKIYTSPKNLGNGKKSILFHNPPVNGKYWSLLAGDDYWTDKNKLDEQLSFLECNHDYIGCSSHTIVKNEVNGNDSLIKPLKNSFNLIDLHIHNGLPPYYVHPSSIIWRNAYRDKHSFLPPDYRKNIGLGDVMLMNAMLTDGRKMKTIDKTMSCYRVTGKGVWSRLSKEEQNYFNNNLMSNILKMLPLKWRIIFMLQRIRLSINFLEKIIPGPLNV